MLSGSAAVRQKLLLLLGVAVTAASTVGAVEFQDFCQAPPFPVSVHWAIDVSPSMAPFLSNLQTTVVSALEQFWADEFDNLFTGVSSFTDKSIITGDGADHCAATVANFPVGSAVAAVGGLNVVGSDPVMNSSLDALSLAINNGWLVFAAGGRRHVIVITDTLPRAPDAAHGLLPFTGALPCLIEDYPTPAQIIPLANAQGVEPIFVVAPEHVDAYRTEFPIAPVVPLRLDPEEMARSVHDAFMFVYCGTPIPTYEPTTTPDVPTTTDDGVCDAAIQLLHIQDISYSFTNDLNSIVTQMPLLFDKIETVFWGAEYALASFSDKPYGNLGYPGDYCYREDHIFTLDKMSFAAAVSNLRILSGRDWRESQYDALYWGINSPTLGWERGDTIEGKPLLRVAIVATDAGPHVAGDSDLPAHPQADCFSGDYPSPASLGAELARLGVCPIFVVTSDVFNYWGRRAAELTGANAKVVEIAGEANAVFDVIMEKLLEICQEGPAPGR